MRYQGKPTRLPMASTAKQSMTFVLRSADAVPWRTDSAPLIHSKMGRECGGRRRRFFVPWELYATAMSSWSGPTNSDCPMIPSKNSFSNILASRKQSWNDKLQAQSLPLIENNGGTGRANWASALDVCRLAHTYSRCLPWKNSLRPEG